MSRTILKIHDDKSKKDYYLEWSSITDSPVTEGMSLSEFKKYYKEEYGRSGMEELPQRLKRVEANATSDRVAIYLDYYFKNNRAGKGEKCLDKEGILKVYCRKK